MKRSFRLLMVWLTMLLLALPVLTAVGFGAVPQEQVSADAKWLLHFDIAQFRSTRVGGYIFKEIVQPQLSGALAQLKRQFKFEIDTDRILDQVNSITIYGTGYQSPENSSVLLVRTDAALEQALVGAMAGLALAGTNVPVQVTQTQVGNVTFYAIKDDAFVAVQPGKLLVLGKSREITEKAARVLAGKAPNLTTSKAFSEFADLKKAFFFLGVAEGFSAETALPPQATVLRMADGGRVVLGENADQLFLNLALRAKNSETVTQMQQVIQGVIALGSLGKPEDQDLAQLVQSVKVTASGNVVSLNMEYPVEGALRVLGENKDKVFKVKNKDKASKGTHAGEAQGTKETKPEAEKD